MGSRVFLDPIRSPSVTTAQRDALSGVGDGDQIYNSSIGSFQQRASGLWVTPQGGTGWFPDTATWKYGAATLIGVPGDATTYLGPGTKISYNDGAVDYGVVTTATAVPAAPVTGVTSTVSSDTFTKTAHGLATFAAVVITGLTNTTGVTNGAVYFIAGGTANTFQLSESIGGAAINLTGADDTGITISAGTLVALVANPTYSVANAALTAPRYSYADVPIGWPLATFPSQPIARGRTKHGGTTDYSVPGVVMANGVSTFGPTINVLYYSFFFVETPITIDQMAFYVATGPASNANVRIGIYAADLDWQPTGAPIVDAGSTAVATAFTGAKTVTVAATLAPGRYMTAFNCDVTMSIRVPRGFLAIGCLESALSGSVLSGGSIASTYGALPTPTPTAWTTIGTVGNHLCVMRISTP